MKHHRRCDRGRIGEALLPGDLMVPDQLIDYTWGRECTYYDSPDAGVKHIDFTMPFDQALSALLISAARRLGKTIVPMRYCLHPGTAP